LGPNTCRLQPSWQALIKPGIDPLEKITRFDHQIFLCLKEKTRTIARMLNDSGSIPEQKKHTLFSNGQSDHHGMQGVKRQPQT
jgi:hypothetical protein